MKKLILLALALIAFQLPTFAHAAKKCTARITLDSSTSNKTIRKVVRDLRRKNYRLLSFNDAVFEDYRLVVSHHGTFTRFYFQWFDAPNYADVFRVDHPTTETNRDSLVLELMKNVPVCKPLDYDL